ncbi:MAG: PDGLE domain-containing protein [Planctomycetes bacterium]|nr:PDGLE domain-containing protein [Planctomycetota bacterium]
MTTYNRNTLIVGIVAALVVGGVMSYFASSSPDGLEKTQEDLDAAEPRHGGVEAPPVAFHEYSLKCLGEGFWSNAAAGVAGSLLVLGIVLLLGRALRRKDAPTPRA